MLKVDSEATIVIEMFKTSLVIKENSEKSNVIIFAPRENIQIY